MVNEDQRIQMECEAAFALLMRRYGDRVTPEMVEVLKGSVEMVVKTTAALRSVSLANGDAPLVCFAPSLEEG